MAIYYKINSGADGAVLTVFGEVNESITSDAKTYGEAVQYLTSTHPEELDRDEVLRLLSPKQAVQAYIRRVSDRVSFKGNTLLFDNDPVHSSLADTIVRLSSEDGEGDPIKLVKFLENLMTNPSEHSREQLYDWIAPRNITITSDGHFLAYKGVRGDFTSVNSGPGIVNNVEYSAENLNNSPGNVLEFPRNKVVADSRIGCAVGLHAGTFDYANGFARGKVVLVKINPRDVVSVPTDCDAQKLRVCRYEVLEEISLEIDNVLWTEEIEVAEDDEDFYGDYSDTDDDEFWDEDDDVDLYRDEEDEEDDEEGGTLDYLNNGEEEEDKYNYLRTFYNL